MKRLTSTLHKLCAKRVLQAAFLVACGIMVVCYLGRISPEDDLNMSPEQHQILLKLHNDGLNSFKMALEQYKILHKQGAENMSHPQHHVRTLTWACSLRTCSGIGDQLLRIQFAFLLAVMSDRVFVISWDDGWHKKMRYINKNVINWDLFDSSMGMCSADDGGNSRCNGRVYANTSPYYFGWTEKEHELFGKALFGPEQHITLVGNLVMNSMFIGDHSMMKAGRLMEEGFLKLGIPAILAKDRYNQVLYYRNSPQYSELKEKGLLSKYEVMPMNNGRIQATDAWMLLNHITFNYLFQFSNDLLAQVDEMKKMFHLKSQPYLAIHLRTGFVGSPDEEDEGTRIWMFKNWKLFHQSVWPCVLNHGIKLADRLFGANVSVYLATDSMMVKKWAKETYGNRVCTSSLVPTHSANNNKVFDDISSWIDFLLLGGSDAMVHGDSSFSINAAFLKPISIARQSWIHEDTKKGCMVSRIGNNAACMC